MSKERIQARVLLGGPMNGVHVDPNDLVEGPPEMIGRFKKLGRVDPSKAAINYCVKQEAKVVQLVKDPEPVEVTEAMMIEVIKEFNPEDESLWTKSGAPKADVIAEICGGPVKAADRDAVWKMIQEGEVE